MNINDIRSKTDKELFGMINKLKAELLALRFQIATGQLDTPHEIKNVKKDIARVYTVIAEHNSGIIIEPKKGNIKTKKPADKSEPKVEAKKTAVESAPKVETKTVAKPEPKAEAKPVTKKAPANKAKGASK